MLRLGQMPFLTGLMFVAGLGLGFAWKTGWIPVEIGSAQTGRLEDESTPDDVDEPPPPDSPSDGILQASASESVADDSEVFQKQSEPTNDDTSIRRQQPALLDASTDAAAPRRLPDLPTNNERPLAPTVYYSRSSRTVQQAGLREPASPMPKVASEAAGDAVITSELQAIDEQIASGETLAAHRALSKLYWNHKDQRASLQSRLDATSKAIFFQPQPHFVEPYVVQPNDQLRVIANKYQLSWEYLARLNKTDPRRIQLGQKLKVVKGPFAAIVDLQDFALTIHLQGYYVKRYEVGIGKEGSSPLGKFSVLNKVENPQYTDPEGRVISGDDPSNPLGERWIDLGDSYGIHGTIEPDSIGKAASRGCIRLRDKDVIEVYDFLIKGSEVVIRK